MDSWRNALALFGAGVVFGAIAVLSLFYFGARPNKIIIGGIEFELPTPARTPTLTPPPSIARPTAQPTVTAGTRTAAITASATLLPSPPPIPQIRIIEPQNSASVAHDQVILGTVSNLPSGFVVWVFAGQFKPGESRLYYWVQRGGPITPSQDGTWRSRAYFDDQDIGREFEITAVIADASINSYLQEYIASIDRNYPVPFLGFPPLRAFSVWHTIKVTRR